MMIGNHAKNNLTVEREWKNDERGIKARGKGETK